MIGRAKQSAWALLIALDILLCTLWLAPLYVFGLSGRPSGRQLISSYVGLAAHNGNRWAILAARVIDLMARLVGGGTDHCRRCWLKYVGRDD